jgi:type II secretory pathway predicted ATPase ExeA
MSPTMNTTVLNFFGFAFLPFSKPLATRQLFVTESFQEAAARLQFAIAEEDFFLLTGAVGVGKSVVLASLTSSLDTNRYTPIYIRGACLSEGELYKAILSGLDREPPRYTPAAKRLYFSVVPELTRKPVVVVDDAQDLQHVALTNLPTMTNFGCDSQSKITFILSGQPELRAHLRLSQFSPLLTRIRLSFHMKPMSLEETCRYIDHHTTAAGALSPLFSDNAKADIHRHTEGIPRAVNGICYRSIIAAAAAGRKIIDSADLIVDNPTSDG